MKWKDRKEELEDLILNKEKSYLEIGRQYGISATAIKNAALRLGIELPTRRKVNTKETFHRGEYSTAICLCCGKEFPKYPSATGKFCSNECAASYKVNKYIQNWKLGKISGTTNYTCSTPIRNYLLKKNNYKCELCGWGEVNPYTNKIPLQIHHIDGNSENNIESNLQVLCPNCHSLTENFGSRNKNAPRGKSIYYKKAKDIG